MKKILESMYAPSCRDRPPVIVIVEKSTSSYSRVSGCRIPRMGSAEGRRQIAVVPRGDGAEGEGRGRERRRRKTSDEERREGGERRTKYEAHPRSEEDEAGGDTAEEDRGEEYHDVQYRESNVDTTTPIVVIIPVCGDGRAALANNNKSINI